MFRKSLKEKLTKIFGIDEVSFDLPDKDTKEQGILYIDVVQSQSITKHKSAKARVIGDIYIYGPNDKLTFGFFNKRLHKAKASDTKDIFFHRMDLSGEYFGNLAERRCSFVYFFSTQYDPEAGLMNEIELDYA